MDTVVETGCTKIALARELVEELEAGNHTAADELIGRLLRERESSLFMEVGRLTRQLHDALLAVELDERIAGFAEQDIPDAKERLHYVIAKTEEAANRTLTAVEELLPMAERIGREADQLFDDLSRFRRREMSVEEFRALLDTLLGFLTDMREGAGRIHDRLSDVLMAQDFQDLTGQVIRRVIGLVQEVQESLVNLVRLSGGAMTPVRTRQVNGVHAEGPQVVAGIPAGSVMHGQDDVDDLLSSLGF